MLEVSMTNSQAVISGLSSELKSERELAQKREQELHQQLEESQMLDQERGCLQDQNKQKEVALKKLTSDLKNEQKHVQEVEVRINEFKRIREDVKKKDEK